MNQIIKDRVYDCNSYIDAIGDLDWFIEDKISRFGNNFKGQFILTIEYVPSNEEVV